MLPSGGYSNSTSSGAKTAVDAKSGDKFSTLGSTNTSLFSNTGIKFSSKGIDPTMVIGGVVALGALFLYFKR